MVRFGALRRGLGDRRGIVAAGAVIVAGSMLVAATSAPAGQPPTGEAVELISRQTGVNGAPFVRNSTRPSISALGDRVGFSTEIFALFGEFFLLVDRGFVRDRVSRETLLQNVNADVVTLSDDGCVVASSQRSTDGSVSYAVNDSCTGESWNVVSPSFYSDAPQPGINADGSIVAFPWFGQMRILQRGDGYVSVSTLQTEGAWTFYDMAMSSNGVRVATIGQPVLIFFAPQPQAQTPVSGSLFAGNRTSGNLDLIPTAANASSPSFDATGNLLGYSDDDGVKVYDFATGQSTLVVPGGRDAHLSRDGRHLTYVMPDTDTHVFAVTRLGASWAGPTQTQFVSSGPGITDDLETATPVTSEHGRWVSWSTSELAYLGLPAIDNDPPSVVIRERRPVLTVGDHGFGPVTEPVETTITITNTGPSGWRATGIGVTGPFSLVSHNCPAVIHPGAGCNARVRFDAVVIGDSTGAVVVSDTSYPGVPLQASGQLTASVPPPPTTPDLGLAFSPNPVDFGSVLLGQTAPNRTATLRNTGTAGLTVGAVTKAGVNQADFTVVSDGCSGVILGVDATCPVVISFAPGAANGRAATLSATGSSGSSASTALRGFGQEPTTPTDPPVVVTTTEPIRFNPVLDVSPGATPTGLVVAVSGRDYPPLDTIQISLGGAAPISVATDGAGAFTLQWLILEGVAQGVYPIDDIATATYDATSVDLQVVSSPVRPQGLPRTGRLERQHVSR